MRTKILKAVLDVPKGTWYFVRKADKAISQARTMKRKHRFDCQMEDIIAVMDCTVFGSGKDGFLLTEKGMYNARDKKHPFVSFSEIEKAEVQKQYYVKIFFKNGETLDWYCQSSDSYIAEVLNRIIKELSSNVAEEKKPAEKKFEKKESERKESETPDYDDWCKRYDLAYERYKNQDYVQAFQMFLALAEEGQHNAQTSVASMYEEGEGTECDFITAAVWYEKAAEQGNRIAQRQLALMYMHGKGVEKNQERCFYWNQKAAEQGHGRAQFDVGADYMDGIVVEKDLKKALYWFEKCAEQGYADAELVCGCQYYLGEWCAQDFQKALFWLRKSEAQGNEKATEVISHVEEDIAKVKACQEAEEKARKEAEEDDLFDPDFSIEAMLELEGDWEEFYKDSESEEKANEKFGERDWEKTLATAERLMKEYIESTYRPKTIQQIKEDGLKALNNLDYEKAQSCFKKANEKTLYAIAVYKDSKATLEQLMEAEFMACEEAAKTNDAKAKEVLEKLRRRLAGVLVNREEERTVDYAGVDLPTRYLALRYALMQNDRDAIATAAYNLAIYYFRRYDNAYMCGVEEAAALCFMAQEQDRMLGNSPYGRAYNVLRDCDSAMKHDYLNPPNAGAFNERIKRLERLADNQPFAAYGRAKYYCRSGKKKEDLWRAEKLAVYAVSAEYKPLSSCYYDATAHKVVCVDVEKQSPEDLLKEIRDKLKAKGWPSKYDMTDRWKEHHALLKKLEKAEKENQKDSYEEAWNAYFYAGENMEKLEKAKAMAEALRRVNLEGSIMDRNSQRLLKGIEAKITYVKGKQYLEEGKFGMASRELDSLKGDDRTREAMYHLARAYLCSDSAFDMETFYTNTKYAIISSGNEELKGLLEVLKFYTEARSFERRTDARAESRYRDAVRLVSDASPYPHPFYWCAKYCMEHAYSVFSKKYNEEKLQTAYDSCKKGMAMIDKTAWLTKEARESLHSSFESLFKDIQSQYRIMNSLKKGK